MQTTLALAVFAAAAAISTSAMAQDGKVYVGADFGAAISSGDEISFIPGVGAGSQGSLDFDSSIGYQGAAFIGYDFGRFRVEAEALRTSAPFDGITARGLIVPGQSAPGTFPADGELETTSYMLNAWVDIGTYRGFEVFVGAGYGRSHVEVSELTAAGGGIILDDEEQELSTAGARLEDAWRNTWQVSAGVRRPLTSNIDVHVRYRFTRMGAPGDDVGMVGYGGRAVQLGDLSSHTVNAGVTFSFW